MHYELRIIPGCPSSARALVLFRTALDAEGADEEIRVVELTSEEQAKELDFHGSPSFIAGGRDLFPSTAPPALACRVYPRVVGLALLPTKDEIRSALRSASSPP
ncbi:thioredoxin domain-containing protein [Arthrobacter sp. D3-16]